MRLAAVFPGQASQQVGMGGDFCDEFAAAREFFSTADRVLGFALSELIFEGPESELTLTANAQPAILTVSCAIWQVLTEFVPPEGVVAFAGHSLGEYTALVAAGSLDFSDAVRLVHLRGRFMQEAVPVGEGKMAAVIGLAAEKIEVVLTAVPTEAGPVQLANINSPDQVVISGSAAAVDAAGKLLAAAGARRVIELNVSAPFHSILMEPAAEKLHSRLEETRFKTPSAPVYANVTAAPYPEEVSAFAHLLTEQITSPVRWVESVNAIAQSQPELFVEVGPGRVLCGLISRTDRSLSITSVGTLEDFKKLLPMLTGEERLQETRE